MSRQSKDERTIRISQALLGFASAIAGGYVFGGAALVLGFGEDVVSVLFWFVVAVGGAGAGAFLLLHRKS